MAQSRRSAFKRSARRGPVIGSSVTALGSGSDKEASWRLTSARTLRRSRSPPSISNPSTRAHRPQYQSARSRPVSNWERIERLRQQAIGLFLDHGIAFATQLFQPEPVQHRDPPTGVADDPELLQL